MAFRTCVKCGAADNPLGRLRFKKSRMDNKVYCENDLPEGSSVAHVGVEEQSSTPRASPAHTSAGSLVVVNCPDCAGGIHRPHQKPCLTCVGYGAVRIEPGMLNVYRPKLVKSEASTPEILMEEEQPRL